MQKKKSLGLLIVSLLILVHFINKNSEGSKTSNYQKASFSFTKCTPTKFMLDVVDTTQQIAPLFNNLGNLNFSISTKNERAQEFFNQGVKLSYAFNHAEGHRSFMEAARLDPKSAMSYWGQAFALGPNINDPYHSMNVKSKSMKLWQKHRNWLQNRLQRSER